MAEVLNSVNGYTFSGITPGNYQFGVAPLTGMPSKFQNIPFIHVQNNNDGSHYIENLTLTGFTLVDKGEGESPSVTITILSDAQ